MLEGTHLLIELSLMWTQPLALRNFRNYIVIVRAVIGRKMILVGGLVEIKAMKH